jgi:hypothetical protein
MDFNSLVVYAIWLSLPSSSSSPTLLSNTYKILLQTCVPFLVYLHMSPFFKHIWLVCDRNNYVIVMAFANKSAVNLCSVIDRCYSESITLRSRRTTRMIFRHFAKKHMGRWIIWHI